MLRVQVLPRLVASWQPIIAGCAMLTMSNVLLFAQPPADTEGDPALPGFEPAMTIVAPEPPKPAAKIAEFVESLHASDAMFEVMVGQGRLLTLKKNIAVADKPNPVIALGDPTVLSFEVLGPRQIRLTGQRVGETDLSILTADGEPYTFEVRVVQDLKVLLTRLSATFPTASLKLTHFHENIVVEGQARDAAQVAAIIQMIEAHLESVYATQARKIQAADLDQRAFVPTSVRRGADAGDVPEADQQPADVAPIQSSVQADVTIPRGRVINRLIVPGSQQVLLKVEVAELNRTAFRQLGASFFLNDGTTKIGTNPSGAIAAATTGGLAGGLFPNTNSVLAGVINGKFTYIIDALRRNNVLKILAEPNLMAYNGHQGSFLAGGEFPVPVVTGGTSVGGAVPTVQWKEFGVRLGFLPYIQDGDIIRLTVASEVSSIDKSLGTVIVPGGTPVPGLNTRKSQTTVELKDGQTLAISGLLQVTLDDTTQRIPGLGDLPVIGPFFSNNTGERIEKELVVLITPHLVEPMDAEQCRIRPGDEINEPNDLEFYLLGRIESRVGRDFRSTTQWDDPLNHVKKLKLEQRYCEGETGFSR